VPDIGFEIHAQLTTRTKLFCGCPNGTGGEPNTRVCPVCLGLPGALPVLNASALDLALRAAVLTGCRPSAVMRFARKNYFYPDLPKGYQITQYEAPVAEGGSFPVRGADPVRIRRVHLEEDAGKSVHGRSGEPSRIDMNRSGVPLVEIVTEPDLHSVSDAESFLRSMRDALVFSGIATGRMHEGSIRFDTNISLRPDGARRRGTQTEIKNLNSFRAVSRALAFEIERQTELLSGGGEVVHETLSWDEVEERAVPSRSKEEESDYRYFDEPDLGPFEIPPERVERVRAAMPELPEAARRRLSADHGLSDEQLDVLVAHPGLVSYFDAAALAFERGGQAAGATVLANWVVGPMLGLARERGVAPDDLETLLPAERLVAVVRARVDGVVSEPAARALLPAAAGTTEPVGTLIERLKLGLPGDEEELGRIVRSVVLAHPDEVRRWREGEGRLLRYFVGLVMKESRGRADPVRARELLEAALSDG
jgi:aspartyl-tRNA(Asn)/glutamyl-tRNA(Gln) amidotransferase subunit B